MGIANEDTCHFVESAKVLGIHRHEHRGIHHYFIVAVVWNDKSQVTVYRKWKNIKRLQRDLIRSLKQGNEKNESRRYLKKTAHRVCEEAQSSRMGELKMTDSLNNFFAAATHYKELAQSQIVRQFFKPNENDMAAISWSKTGKTYLCVPRDVLGERCADSSNSTTVYENSGVTTARLDSAGEEHQDSEDDTDDRYRGHATNSIIFTVLADYNGNERGTISIQKHEKVEVIKKDESGWWLVRKRSHRDASLKDLPCGYVPAAYLSSSDASRKDYKINNADFGLSMLMDDGNCGQSHDAHIESDSSLTAPSDKSSNDSRDVSSVSTRSVCSSSTSSQSTSSDESDDVRKMVPRPTFAQFEQKPQRARFRLHSSAVASLAISKKSGIGLSTNYSKYLASVEETTSSPGDGRRSSTENIAIQRIGNEYVCKESYEATSTEELSFEEGSILRVLRRNTDGWWLATHKGKTGLVPGVHLQRYRDPIKRLSLQMMGVI